MDCVITIELGTNAVRVFAFDISGKTIGSMKGSYPTFHIQPDYSEQDPQQIFITMLYVLKNLVTEVIHPKRYTVTHICFSASMHSVLAIDRNGEPLGNVITWADNRGKKEAQDLKGSPHGKKLYDATGTPIHPMSPLVKIMWLKHHDQDRFNLTYKFLSIKSYIIHQLTSEYAIDYSLASATGLFNIHTLKWEAAALDYIGITTQHLPDLTSVFAAPGKLRREYQTSLGLGPETKIMIGSSDGCLATLGAGVWDDGSATVTIEDSGAVRVVGKDVLKDDQQRFFNYRLTEDYFVSGGPTNNGGVVFEWFAKQFGDLRDTFNLESCIDNLFREAAQVEPGAKGLLFLPYLLGERAPLWDANARGSYFGINIKHERHHFIRATIEGILYEIFSIGKILQEHRQIKRLSVNGSFGTLPLCTQMLADIFNKPVVTLKESNSIGPGAFLLCATDMGQFKNLYEASQSVTTGDLYKPDDKSNQIYDQHFRIFERLSSKLKDEFAEIAKLQQQ